MLGIDKKNNPRIIATTITVILIIGFIYIISYFIFPIDTHCICDDGTVIFTHKYGFRNLEEYCYRFGNCKTFAGLDIDGQWEELENARN